MRRSLIHRLLGQPLDSVRWTKVAALCGICFFAWADARASDAATQAAAKADRELVRAIRAQAHPLRENENAEAALIAQIGGARFVLLGEDTHGTEEIYSERERITMALIEQLGFDGLVVESDFSAIERTNRYVRHLGADPSAAESLLDHRRFPRWMWLNAPFARLIERLARHNLHSGHQVEVFGMDLHGLDAAADKVLRRLAVLDPADRQGGAAALACLGHHRFEANAYRAALLRDGLSASCELPTQAAQAAVAALLEQVRNELDADSAFSLRGNLAQVLASEAYSRLQTGTSAEAWNYRDQHFAEAVSTIAGEIEARTGRPAKLVVWAHNTHVADARATDRGRRSGYRSLGQEMRERFPEQVFILGFTTRLGTVRAAAGWDAPDRVYALRRPAWESVSAIFGRARLGSFLLPLRGAPRALSPLDANVPMRAIGVVYWPQAERREHYFRGDLSGMFDAVIHLDRSQALRPIAGDGRRTTPIR